MNFKDQISGETETQEEPSDPTNEEDPRKEQVAANQLLEQIRMEDALRDGQ